MQILIIGGFLVAAIINFLPVMGVIGAPQLERMYGVAVQGPDLAVLMRHRAILFGIVGALLAAAAFVPSLRWTAFFAGMLSMVSFLVFQALEGGTNAELGSGGAGGLCWDSRPHRRRCRGLDADRLGVAPCMCPSISVRRMRRRSLTSYAAIRSVRWSQPICR